MQQRCVPGRLGVDVEAEAIQELVVNSRQALSSQLLAPRAEPGPHRQAMLAGQRQCQVEDVAAPAIGQAMPVQVGGRQAGAGYGIDLRTELKLHLVEASP